ncbi:MAG: glycoside hydrolase family 127 protein [Sedimentisphaerales bacterium]|nr:glycoside hydrolase family 127 protein [Sedimentisphaerales bacterium]
MDRGSIWRVSVLAIIVSLQAESVFAQGGGGDQFLDGIGETALIARYVFNGNAQDWSRNNYHATVNGTQAAYVEDSQFGTVLSLPGGADGGHVRIPGQALIGIDTLSVTGWLYIRSTDAWQRFFDFGQDTTRNFFCTPIGEEPAEGYRARITTSGWTAEQGPAAPRVPTERWIHLAVVLDTAKHILSIYLDGRIAAQAEVELTLEQVLDQENAAANLLYLGKSRYETDVDLNAKIYDVRLYSIALSDRQVAAIRINALAGEQVVGAETEPAGQDEPAAATETAVLPNASQLIGVPDITAETPVGQLPRLPHMIPGTYGDGATGPMLRVIWPAPTDNSQVRAPGVYTVTGTVPGTTFQPKATVTVKAAAGAAEGRPQHNLEPFGLGQVVLNQDESGRDTQFIKNRDKFVLTLAETDPNSFLYNFRDAFGRPQPEGVRPLRGWDSQTTRLRGHASGHYLSAIAQAYGSTTYDADLHANFLQKMNYMIDTLYDLAQKSGKPAEEGGPYNADPTKVPPGPGRDGYDSDLSAEGIRTDYWNWGKGFISGYPPDQFIMLEHGATYGGRNNQIWAPYYTLHKILAGLLDCYEVGGNEKALEIAKGMGLWVYARLKVVPTETRISMWNRYIAGEFGGMNEVMARLYRLTSNRQYLECAQLFDNIDFFFGNAEHEHGLAMNVDTIRGKHANQHIPQITGALETYKGTREPAYYHVAENFWDLCTHCYMYSIGGVGGAKNPNNAECFTAQPNTLFANGFNQGGQNESCATYNMLKLSRQLFMFDQDGKYMDYYEQGLYNHILASVAENDPGNTYHVPLNPGARRQFSNARMTGFTCCNGTGLESNTKLQDSIYFRSDDHKTLYVNLYVPSTLTWTEQKVTVKQSTNFPYADTTKLTLGGGGAFDIKVRVPRWATRGFFVTINGQAQTVQATPGTYLTLSRTWKDGDTIELRMPMDFYLMRVMDQPSIASIFYGPVLLAVEESAARSEWRAVTLDAVDIGKSIAGDPATLRFTTNGVNLKPFYETYDRYSVYLDVTLK